MADSEEAETEEATKEATEENQRNHKGSSQASTNSTVEILISEILTFNSCPDNFDFNFDCTF